MPGRALRMVLEWLDLHRDELLANLLIDALLNCIYVRRVEAYFRY